MKKIIFCFLLSVISLFATAQNENASDETAKTYIRQGDYQNAILVLNQALQKDNQNLEMLKDLAFAYYLQRDFEKSLGIAKPLVSRADADVQSFQILGMVYKAIEEKKDCEKMYRQGLKRFPKSGVLYNEYGEVLGTENGNEAIKLWEKGIEVDPGYSSNYYNASLYYYAKNEKIWSVIYGEIFINIESYSSRTEHIKDLLTDEYKKIFADEVLMKAQNIKNEFASAFVVELSNHSAAVANGVSPESLTAVRNGFILGWFEKNAQQFPFHLFDYMQQLTKLGMFEAYNQWVFGASQNPDAFHNWVQKHSDDYNKFISFQKNRVFKIPGGQYYQTIGK
ncbi:MAG TPA: tetratricopeptide repeat protein [Puia sp.]|nr:tetratricopeptide repeat protein [Puia sp.]